MAILQEPPLGSPQTDKTGATTTIWSSYTTQLYSIVKNLTSSFAPVSATYITKTANAELTNEQPLSALATGFVKVANGTGTLTSQTTITASDLAATAVVAGSYTINGAASYTVDAQGRLTASASPVITVTGTANKIDVSGGTGITPTITMSPTYVGQTSITTLGTIATGTWQGTAIANAYLANGAVANLSGTNTGDQTISDATITTTDIITNNATTAKHGFLKKLSNVAGEFMDGTGNWSSPAGSGTVNTGAALKLAYYPGAGTTVDDMPSSGYVGVTDASNVTAGNVGEVISSSIAYASRVTMTSNTATNITTISLTAGDWDVYGNVYIEEDTAALTQATAWISTTSATRPDQSLYAGGVITGNPISVVAPFIRINVSGTTTVYLSAYATQAAGTIKGCGNIYARRAR